MSDEERIRLTLQLDQFIELLAKRYGVEPQEVVAVVLWYKEHQAFLGKVKVGALVGLFGIVISSLLLAIWEGVKSLITTRLPLP